MLFPVFNIDPQWVLESEQLGTKEKFWFRAASPLQDEEGPFDESEWLFKFPTPGTGQHWAEKIAYEIALKMEIDVPRVELVALNGANGSATANFTQNGWDLFHGNQILAGFDPEYDRDQRLRQNNHTIGRIFDALGALFPDPTNALNVKKTLAGYLLLDALICNVDRHHENWGVLRKNQAGKLAPSFDHASSLGRELKDSGGKQNRERYLTELGVEKYRARGRGPIFVDGTGRHGPSPFRLVERCLEIDELAPYFRTNLPKLDHLNSEHFESSIAGIPEPWMSVPARSFALSLLNSTLNALKNLS